jgi:hypothetical protein
VQELHQILLQQEVVAFFSRPSYVCRLERHVVRDGSAIQRISFRCFRGTTDILPDQVWVYAFVYGDGVKD